MKVVVTGASGLVGGNLAVELVRCGHSVRATRRSGSRTDHLAEFPIEWVTADLGDERALREAFRGAEAVFHCAAMVTIRKAVTPEVHATNVEGTRNVVRAAIEQRVGRLVHCSTVNAVGLSEDGRPCTEESRWNFPEHGMDDAYTITKHEAEGIVRREASELDWVIVNPCYMFGPYDTKPTSGKLIVDVARRKIPGNLPGYNNFVDVRDVARGVLLALEKGKRGERYILGGEDMSYPEIVARIARIAGVDPPDRTLPRFLANLVGRIGDLQERLFDREPLLNSTTVKYGFCTTFRFSSEKAERELGYRHGPVEPAISDALAYLRSAGMV